MIAIVSQAKVGGSATAVAIAESLGNALGTYLGFLVIYIL